MNREVERRYTRDTETIGREKVKESAIWERECRINIYIPASWTRGVGALDPKISVWIMNELLS